MTPDRNDLTHDEPENGVLADGASIDTAAIGLLGGVTAQVDVTMPAAHDDVDYVEDEAIDDAASPAELDALGLLSARDADADRGAGVDRFESVDTDTVVVGIIEPDGDDSAYEDATAQDTAFEDTSFEDVVFVEAIDEDSAVEDSPSLDAEVATAEFEDTPVEDTPVEDTPVEDAPVEDAPVEDAPVEDAPSEAAPVGGTVTSDTAARHVEREDYADNGAAADDAAADHAANTDAEEAEMADATFPDDAVSRSAAADGTTTAAASVDRAPAAASAVAVAPTTPAAVAGSTAAERHRAHSTERVRTHRDAAEVALTPRRLGEIESSRESADLLTADRLLDTHAIVRSEPEGLWQHLVYSLSGRRINLGDGKRARERKEVDRRIAGALGGRAKFVPVLSRKGGVGKTTITALLGMALADARDDRVIAVDANPDRGTLAERISRSSGKTVRDLVRMRDDVIGYNDLSAVVARDETRLDVLASDSDPHVSEAFSDRDYHDVATLAAHYYSLVLTDTGTGIVHSVMGATLDLADQIVVVAGLSVDEARLASETLTWLESNGYIDEVRNAVVVLNTARPGAPLVRADELEAHFRTRVRAVVRMPYDAHIATGSAITFRELRPETRKAARELAARVVEGLRALNAAA